MFNHSTQKKFWFLDSSEKIAEMQLATNESFIAKYKDLCLNNKLPMPAEYLAYHEEKLLLIFYSRFVYDLCCKFKPPVPMSVIGMSLMYFKRFYLSTSVMELHPKDVAYLSVYLACKVDEYNVSIDQFMSQVVSRPQPHIQMFIIDNELLFLQKLNYHLTIHSPYRPLEGFIIDIKTRKCLPGIDVEHFRQNAEKFLANSMLTDICLLFPPSQIAMAALYYSLGSQFHSYLKLLTDSKSFRKLLETLENIKENVTNFKSPTKEEVMAIEEKLNQCRDHENNPESELYHQREIAKKEAKDIQKRKKYQELYEIEKSENKLLAQDMSM